VGSLFLIGASFRFSPKQTFIVMVKKEVVQVGQKNKSNKGFRTLSEAFYEASRISFSLVFFPIVLLLLGVWADKKFGTTPLFIIAGIISGVLGGIYQATRIKKETK